MIQPRPRAPRSRPGEAEAARERELCDGPSHCYKPALDGAERLLAAIGGARLLASPPSERFHGALFDRLRAPLRQRGDVVGVRAREPDTVSPDSPD